MARQVLWEGTNIGVWKNDAEPGTLAITPLATFSAPRNALVIDNRFVFADVLISPLELKEAVARQMSAQDNRPYQAGQVVALPLARFSMSVIHPDIDAKWERTGDGNSVKLNNQEVGRWECRDNSEARLLADSINRGTALFRLQISWFGREVGRASISISGKHFRSDSIKRFISSRSDSVTAANQFFTHQQIDELLNSVRENVNAEAYIDHEVMDAFPPDRQLELLQQFIKDFTSRVSEEEIQKFDEIFIGREAFTPDKLNSESTKIAEELTTLAEGMTNSLFEVSDQGRNSLQVQDFESEFRRHVASGGHEGEFSYLGMFDMGSDWDVSSDYLKKFVDSHKQSSVQEWKRACKQHLASAFKNQLSKSSFKEFAWEGEKFIPKQFSLNKFASAVTDVSKELSVVVRVARNGSGRIDEERRADQRLLPGQALVVGRMRLQLVRIPSDDSSSMPPFMMSTDKVPFAMFAMFVDETGYKTVAEVAAANENPFTSQRLRKAYSGSLITSIQSEYAANPELYFGSGLVGLKSERGRHFSWQDVGYSQTDFHPVVNITYSDALAFCSWLSLREGRVFRLATLKEFEHAVGTKSDDFWSNLHAVWVQKAKPLPTEISFVTTPIGLSPPTDRGLRDVYCNGNELVAPEDMEHVPCLSGSDGRISGRVCPHPTDSPGFYSFRVVTAADN